MIRIEICAFFFNCVMCEMHFLILFLDFFLVQFETCFLLTRTHYATHTPSTCFAEKSALVQSTKAIFSQQCCSFRPFIPILFHILYSVFTMYVYLTLILDMEQNGNN